MIMKDKKVNTYKVNKRKGTVEYTTKAYDVYYTGKAKVNKEDGDVFDEATGKRIAFLRAIMKMKKSLLKENLNYLEFIRNVSSMEEEIQTKVQLLTESYYRLEEKLNDIIKK